MADVKIPEHELPIVVSAEDTDFIRLVLANHASRSILIADLLKDYITSTDLTTVLADYATTQDLNNALVDYVTITTLNSVLGNYVTTSQLNSSLANYVTNTNLTITLLSYVTSSSLSSTLLDYVTNASLGTTLNNYVRTSDLTTILADYVLTTDLNTVLNNYLTIAAYQPFDSTLPSVAAEVNMSSVGVVSNTGAGSQIDYNTFKGFMQGGGLETYVGRLVFPADSNSTSADIVAPIPLFQPDPNVTNNATYISTAAGNLQFNTAGRYKIIINIMAEIDWNEDPSILADRYNATTIYYDYNGDFSSIGGTRLVYPIEHNRFPVPPATIIDPAPVDLTYDWANSTDVLTLAVTAGSYFGLRERGRRNRLNGATVSVNILWHRVMFDVYYLGA